MGVNLNKVIVFSCYPPVRHSRHGGQWGLVNFDCSTLWVRNSKDLTNALDITPEYLRTMHHDTGQLGCLCPHYLA